MDEKLDTRVAIFKDDKILLVRENNGKPGWQVQFDKGRNVCDIKRLYLMWMEL